MPVAIYTEQIVDGLVFPPATRTMMAQGTERRHRPLLHRHWHKTTILSIFCLAHCDFSGITMTAAGKDFGNRAGRK